MFDVKISCRSEIQDGLQQSLFWFNFRLKPICFKTFARFCLEFV
jgi:hypothetical protein